MHSNDLIYRLQVRAADPARRVDAPQSRMGASIASMGLSDMFGMMGSLAGDLSRVVGANRSGQPLPGDLVERADELGSAMTESIESELPPAATVAALDRAEAELGQPLPAAFREIYAAVADGGFGPGSGLLALDVILTTYRELLADPPAPLGLAWPARMVPIVIVDPGYYCLELPGGRVIDWDPEESYERQDEAGWAETFQDLAADLETWLSEWVRSRTPAEERADAMTRMRREAMRETRERIAAMTPAERAAVGLPEEGWEEAFTTDYD